MKKLTSFLALVLALSIPSGVYAAEAKLDDNNTTANGNVYAVYTEDVPWNSVPVDDDGNAVIDFPDGTSVKIENADKDKNLVVDQVTEKEALDWLNSVMGKKSENTVAFHIYYIDGDSILPANGIKVTINIDKDQVNSVKGDGTVSSLKCEESDAYHLSQTMHLSMSLVQKHLKVHQIYHQTALAKKMIAYKTVHRQQFKM